MSSINRKFFFDRVRLTLFDGSLKKEQVGGLTAILDYWEDKYAAQDDRWLAYILATAHHEVDKKMQPIHEYGGNSYFHRMYDIKGSNPTLAKRLGNLMPGDGVRFRGRGFVQLTGRYNYANWQSRLGMDLTSSDAMADRVLDPAVATRILIDGMVLGTFTGRKLADYFATVREDWEGARAIINGRDKKALIKSYALPYYAALSYTTA